MVDIVERELLQGVRLCISILPYMLLSCLLGSLVSHFRPWHNNFRFASHISRLTGLTGPVLFYPFLSFLDAHSANAFLGSLVKHKKIYVNQILGIYLIGVLFSSLYFHIFFSAPILYPGFGSVTASIVIGLYVMASFLTFSIGIVFLRINVFRERNPITSHDQEVEQSLWPGWKVVILNGLTHFFKIAAFFVSYVIILELFLEIPFVKSFMDKADVVFLWAGVPSEGLLITIASLPSIILGYATAITCIDDSLIAAAQIPKILIIAAIGNIIFSSFSLNMTTNMSIFGIKIGSRLTLSSLAIRIACLLVSLCLASLIIK